MMITVLRFVTLLLMATMSSLSSYAQDTPGVEEPEWLLNTMKDALTVAAGDTLIFHHSHGDVRIETADTDRIQVTAIAQYRADDPRLPELVFDSVTMADGTSQHRLGVDFINLDIAEDDAWNNHRIDVGILVPVGLLLDIVTGDGLIEAKNIEVHSSLNSNRGDIEIKGTGSVIAHTKRGNILAHLRQTGATHSVNLSTLTGDIRTLFLEGANARVKVTTRGPITTDYSIKMDREAGSPLKQGQVQIGESGSDVVLTSHSGGIRLQGLIVHE